MSKWMKKEEHHEEFFEEINEDVIDWNFVAKGEHKVGDEVAIEKQGDLCVEELLEGRKAWGEGDKVEFLDYLCDGIVVRSYCDFLNGNPLYLADSQFLCTFEGIWGDWDRDRIPPLQGELRYLLINFDGDFKGALREVLRSNWSKFDNYSQEDESLFDEHCKKIMGEGRYKGVYWIKRNDLVVYFDENGKVLKGKGFSKPQLGEFANV